MGIPHCSPPQLWGPRKDHYHYQSHKKDLRGWWGAGAGSCLWGHWASTVTPPGEDMETDRARRAKGSYGCFSSRDPWRIRLVLKKWPQAPCQPRKRGLRTTQPITQKASALSTPQFSPQWELSLEKRGVMQRISEPECASHLLPGCWSGSRVKEQTLDLPLQPFQVRGLACTGALREGTLFTKRQILYDSGNLMRCLEKSNSYRQKVE